MDPNVSGRFVQPKYCSGGIEAEKVEKGVDYGIYHTTFKIKDDPLVSVIIPNKDHRQDLDLSVSLFRIEVSDHRALMQEGRKLELHDGIDEDAHADRDVRHRVEGVLEREHEDDDGKRGKQTLAEGAEGREITRLDYITTVVQPVVIDRAVLVIMVDAEPAQDIYFRALIFIFDIFFLIVQHSKHLLSALSLYLTSSFSTTANAII